MATCGVRHHLRRGEVEIAAALQPVAAALWGAAADRLTLDPLGDARRSALAAIWRLDRCSGASAARLFLADLAAFLEDAGWGEPQ